MSFYKLGTSKSPLGRDAQLKNSSDGIGPWAYLRDAFIISAGCKRVQPTVSSDSSRQVGPGM